MIHSNAIHYQHYRLVEVTTQELKSFTGGIDSPQLQLLCRSSDTNIPLGDVQWTSQLDSQLNILNPFIVSTLNNGFHRLQCNRGSDTSFTYFIVIQGNSKHIRNEIHI